MPTYNLSCVYLVFTLDVMHLIKCTWLSRESLGTKLGSVSVVMHDSIDTPALKFVSTGPFWTIYILADSLKETTQNM